MNDEFQVWVLLLGLGLGAAIAWFALGTAGTAADPERLETDDERALEAAWLARELEGRGQPVDPVALETALALHRDLGAGRLINGGDDTASPAGRQ
ncbi:MAG: hypothetical protein MUC54_08805 [Chloroflexi bacterium]|nr:hypothetical protein [Chloroflexota bacterium]